MAQLQHGDTLAGYRIETRVGDGSTGEVYTALDTSLDRRVALKVLRPDLARDDRFRERFLRESRVAASLEHPNIVPIHAVGEEGDVLFIAMRYVDGRDLGEILDQAGRLDPERTLALLAQVASALDAAHDRGLVHRDVKPGNILVARHGDREQAYLCDFGLAKHASTVTSLTGERSVFGTVDYLAPEQIEGRPVDGRIDVYGLGCVLYECLAGTPPFARENELAAIVAHLREPPPRLTEQREDLPAAIDEVVARALAKDRDERYATCGDLMLATATALAGEAPAAPAMQTFLFCDIRGYTAYTRDNGDEAGATLAAAFAGLVADTAQAFDGRLQELRGDEGLLVFASPRQALRFALALQRRISEDGLPRGVGVGLDAGEAVPVAGGFRGGALNRAARLCALAGAGEVLASDAVVHLAGKVDGVAYGHRRLERLKGFDEPVGLVGVHPAGSVPPPPRRRPSRRPFAIAAAAMAVAAIAVAAAAAIRNSGGRGPATAAEAAGPPANAIVALDPATGRPLSSIAGQTAWAFVTAPGALYALDPNRQFLTDVDPSTGTVRGRIPIENPHRFLPTVEFGSIWYTTEDGDRVVRVDPVYRRVTKEVRLPHRGLDENLGIPPGGVARVGDEIWVTYGYPTRLARIDPTNDRVVSTRLPDGSPTTSNLVADGRDVWVVYDDGSVVARLGPTGQAEATGKIAGGSAVDAAAAEGYLWVTMDSINGVWKIGRDASPVKQVPTGSRTWAMTAAGGDLWISNAGSGTVTRLDPRTDATRQVVTGHRPLGVAVSRGRLWVGLDYSAADARKRVAGVRVVTASIPQEAFTLDPAAVSDSTSAALGYPAGAGLMQYRPAADGSAEVVPDLAAGDPVASGDGRRYTFRVRPGMRFSPPSGAPVTAVDVAFSLERMIEQDGYCALALFPDIRGARAFADGKASHVSGIAVDGDAITLTLSAPSETLPARLSSPCTHVVPVGTPPAGSGLIEPIPSAGPYYVDTRTFGEQIVLRRNPGYHGPRAAPLDAVILTASGDAERGAALVEAGKADYAIDLDKPSSPAFAPDGRLAKAYGGANACPAAAQRCFARPLGAAVRFLQLDTRSGPFADRDVRRAIVLALDRTALARAGDGDPASRLIGPGVAGYRPEQLVPVRGDVAAARALMRGRHVTMVLPVARFNDRMVQFANALRTQLAPIGVAVDVRRVDDPFREAARPDTWANALVGGWIPDYPDAENAIYPVVSPRSPNYAFPTWLDDQPLFDRIDAARATSGEQRVRAWSAIDADIVDGGAFIPLYTESGFAQLFSQRVGCQTFLPLYDGVVDLGSLCLR